MAENKTPYELRLEMLQMAKDYLDTQYNFAREAAMTQWQTNVEFASKLKDALAPKMPEMPKMYGIEEITKMAEQFNKFISGK